VRFQVVLVALAEFGPRVLATLLLKMKSANVSVMPTAVVMAAFGVPVMRASSLVVGAPPPQFEPALSDPVPLCVFVAHCARHAMRRNSLIQDARR